ncbi:hypothetical protein ACFL54_05880 [Planctomycetota bacterium]
MRLEFDIVMLPGKPPATGRRQIEFVISRLTVSTQVNKKSITWNSTEPPADIAEEVDAGTVSFEHMIIYVYSHLVNKTIQVNLLAVPDARRGAVYASMSPLDEWLPPPRGMWIDEDRPNPISAIERELLELINIILLKDVRDKTSGMITLPVFSPAHWDMGSASEELTYGKSTAGSKHAAVRYRYVVSKITPVNRENCSLSGSGWWELNFNNSGILVAMTATGNLESGGDDRFRKRAILKRTIKIQESTQGKPQRD